jgi:acyl-CoA thioester hydrolase
MFVHRHKVQFYETDLMGIVHHSNYLRFYEEARVAWAHAKNLLDYQRPESASHFAVYETAVKHAKPAFFGDDLEIEVQAQQEGIRIVFQYRMKARGQLLSVAKTVHVSLDKNLKLMRLPEAYTKILESEKWTETWL